jgi:hypothetical protein
MHESTPGELARVSWLLADCVAQDCIAVTPIRAELSCSRRGPSDIEATRTGHSSTLRNFQMETAAQNRAYLLPSAKTINLSGLKCFYSAMKAQDASDIINVGRRFRNGAVIQEFFVKSSRSTRFSSDRITSCRCPSKGFCSKRLRLTTRSTSPARTRQSGWVETHWRTLLPQGRRGGKRQDQSPNSS